MNDGTSTGLKIIVERAVRPVRASTSLKRKMREELLGHVSGVYDEERARLDDDRKALERTALRFGNPADVTSQLQESVRFGDCVERFWEGRPGESTFRGALRLAVMFELFMLFICGTLLLASGSLNGWVEGELAAVAMGLDFVPQYSFGPVYLLAIAFVTRWLESGLHGPEPLFDWPRLSLRRSFDAAWAVPLVRLSLIAGSSCFLLLMCLRAANWSTPLAEWNLWLMVAGGILFAGDLAATSVLAAWALVQSAEARRRYHAEWSRLPI